MSGKISGEKSEKWRKKSQPGVEQKKVDLTGICPLALDECQTAVIINQDECLEKISIRPKKVSIVT